MTEQKGRARINLQILDLKNLLPECRFVPTTKASVLECASASLRRLQNLSASLSTQNKNLTRENKRLHAELNRLRDSGVFVQNITMTQEDTLLDDVDLNNDFLGGSGDFVLSPDQLLLGSPPKSSFMLSPPPEPFPGVVNVMEGVNLPAMVPDPRPLSSLEMDPFIVDYASSPSTGSSPLYSPNTSQSFLSLSGSDLSSPDSSDQDFDGSSFKRFTKRRLLFVFLFMIPLFLTLEPLLPSGTIINEDQPKNTRVMLSESGHRTMLSMDDYWDMARVIWFVVGGLMGIAWIINAILWANKLSEEYTYQDNGVKKTETRSRDSSLLLKKKAIRTAAKMRLNT